MNFFGHAFCAASLRPEPGFVLGAMLPDLCAMSGQRLRGAGAGALGAGIRHHQRSDAAFHGDPGFRRACSEGTSALQRAGVRRGPARGAAHAGLELLLDGWIAVHRGVPDCYRDALALGREEHTESSLSWRGHVERGALGRVCARVHDSPLPEAYSRPPFATRRLVRLLARRPRLALEDAELRPVRAWMEDATCQLDDIAPQLLAGVSELEHPDA